MNSKENVSWGTQQVVAGSYWAVNTGKRSLTISTGAMLRTSCWRRVASQYGNFLMLSLMIFSWYTGKPSDALPFNKLKDILQTVQVESLKQFPPRKPPKLSVVSWSNCQCLLKSQSRVLFGLNSRPDNISKIWLWQAKVTLASKGSGGAVTKT